MRPLSAFIVILLCASLAHAQDLSNIGKSKPFALNGGLSLNQIFYGAHGIESRRDPYSYFATGNLNLSLYGWSVPVSFSVSNQNTSFQQPFNQYSLNPTYKWVTAHIGYTSVSYSPYTVNGHIFLGGAVDLAPEESKWRFSALYGRFLKAVELDTLNPNSIPSYKRMGYGFKTSYINGRDFVDLSLFHAEDDISSIGYIPDSLNVLPQENLVISIGAGKSFLKHFLLKAEWATSAMSSDTRAISSEVVHPMSKVDFLFQPRLSSSFYNAMKAAFDYQHELFTVGLGYERIDPQYRTLGAYFFNNDLENITVNATAILFQGKMNVAVSTGSQRDNLDKSKISTLRRGVSSVNVNYAPSQRLSLSASYSNFQTYTNIRSQFQQINQLTPYENLDTLNFTQLSQNAALNAMYTFGSDTRKQNLNVNLTVQDAADKQGDVPQNSGMRFYNVNTAYAVNFVPQAMIVSLSANATINSSAAMDTKTFGPVLSVSKSFLNRKVRTVLSSSYNKTYSEGVNINTIVNTRLTGTLSVQKKHNVNTSFALVNRQASVAGANKAFSEFTATLGYSYAFGLR